MLPPQRSASVLDGVLPPTTSATSPRRVSRQPSGICVLLAISPLPLLAVGRELVQRQPAPFPFRLKPLLERAVALAGLSAASNPSTLMSSSRSGQWMPCPPPINSHLPLSSSVACTKRGYQPTAPRWFSRPTVRR